MKYFKGGYFSAQMLCFLQNPLLDSELCGLKSTSMILYRISLTDTVLWKNELIVLKKWTKSC